MITDEHFETLRRVREEAANLRLICIAADRAGSLLHLAFDPDISLRPTKGQSALLGKLRAVQ